MLPVLNAQEALAHINEMAVAFGAMDKQHAGEFLFALRTSASIHRGDVRLARRPRSAAELGMLSEGAIGVVLEPGPKTVRKEARKAAARSTATKSPSRALVKPQTPSGKRP